MTDVEQMILLRKTIKSLYVQNSIGKAIIEDLHNNMTVDASDYFNVEIPSYEDTVRLLDEIMMR